MSHPVTRIDYASVDSVRRAALNVLKRCPEAKVLSSEMLEEIADMVVARNFHGGYLRTYQAIVAACHAELE